MPREKRRRADQATEVGDSAREELFRRKLAKKQGKDDGPSAASKGTSPQSEAAGPSTPKIFTPLLKPQEKASGSEAGIWVNRAPVLTLWVAKVAERQGFSRDAGLSFGRRIAGIMAHSKGRRIGVYEDAEQDEDEEAARKRAEEEEKLGVRRVDVFHMHIKALDIGGGDLRAVESNLKPIDAKAVDTYLHRAFGARLGDAERALATLTEAFPPKEIGAQAYGLYTQFRPSIPDGQAGWGKKGLFDIAQLRDLAPSAEQA